MKKQNISSMPTFGKIFENGISDKAKEGLKKDIQENSVVKYDEKQMTMWPDDDDEAVREYFQKEGE